jgi:hypothetical protein
LAKRSFGSLDIESRERLALRQIGNELEILWDGIVAR